MHLPDSLRRGGAWRGEAALEPPRAWPRTSSEGAPGLRDRRPLVARARRRRRRRPALVAPGGGDDDAACAARETTVRDSFVAFAAVDFIMEAGRLHGPIHVSAAALQHAAARARTPRRTTRRARGRRRARRTRRARRQRRSARAATRATGRRRRGRGLARRSAASERARAARRPASEGRARRGAAAAARWGLGESERQWAPVGVDDRFRIVTEARTRDASRAATRRAVGRSKRPRAAGRAATAPPRAPPLFAHLACSAFGLRRQRPTAEESPSCGGGRTLKDSQEEPGRRAMVAGSNEPAARWRRERTARQRPWRGAVTVVWLILLFYCLPSIDPSRSSFDVD